MPLPSYTIAKYLYQENSIYHSFYEIIRFVWNETSPILQSNPRNRSSVKLLQTIPISKHLVASRPPCNDTILQLIIHEVNRRDRDWPHSSSRIAPLSSVLLTNPLSMRIPSREATATQFRRSSNADPRLLTNLHTTVSRLITIPFDRTEEDAMIRGAHRGIFSHRKINRPASLC